MGNTKKTILVLNQHGENRGDEAAMRALIRGVEKQAQESFHFVFLVQFRDDNLPLKFEEDVELVNMVMTPWNALRFVLVMLLSIAHINVRFILPVKLRVLVQAYDDAVLVMSAPGGPYFGDIYIKHEIVHWFFVFLAAIKSKKLFLYSPSAGPFENKPMNWVRKTMYKRFDVLCVRERQSKAHINQLIPGVDVEVTADSALQDKIIEVDIKRYIPEYDGENKIVAVSLIDYKFPDCDDKAAYRKKYQQAFRDLIVHIWEKDNDHVFLFFPQLYGAFHSDVGFIDEFIRLLPGEIRCQTVDHSNNSDIQRGLIAKCFLCVASRYHPQIFAVSARVPVLGICYEHKSFGFMALAGLSNYAIDIRTVSADNLISMYEQISDSREDILARIDSHLPGLIDQASLSSSKAIKLLRE